MVCLKCGLCGLCLCSFYFVVSFVCRSLLVYACVSSPIVVCVRLRVRIDLISYIFWTRVFPILCVEGSDYAVVFVLSVVVHGLLFLVVRLVSCPSVSVAL